jgi:diacylglycerol kinase (ATP)
MADRAGFVLLQSHAACYKQITGECTFGNLEPIYLPPHAVSIPRTEVPMEAIIGVQVRRRETMSREYSCRKCCFQLTSRWRI